MVLRLYNHKTQDIIDHLQSIQIKDNLRADVLTDIK